MNVEGVPKGKGIWETIPEQIRMGGESEIKRFLKNKDWSHTIPKSKGGSSTADNGIFELMELNRERGDIEMTPDEIDAAKKVIKSDAIRSVLRQTTSAMVKGALAAVIMGGLLLCLECGLQYAEGKITWNQMVDKIVRASALAGLSAIYCHWPYRWVKHLVPSAHPDVGTGSVCASNRVTGVSCAL